MSETFEWLPELITLNDYEGNWPIYCDAIYDRFKNTMIEDQPRFEGKWIRCRRDPIYDNKYAGCWHCMSEGPNEEDRTPDMRRCERILWPRAIIDNAELTEAIDVWKNQRGRNKNILFWFNEEYLVVLSERTRRRDGFEYLQFITAYCTPEESRKRKLRSERDAWNP